MQQGLNGYTGVADTYVDAWNQEASFGQVRQLLLRGDDLQLALLRFELPPLPAEIHVVQALLSLWVLGGWRTSAGDREAAASVDLYRLEQPWQEDETTWLAREIGHIWSQPLPLAKQTERVSQTPVKGSGSWVTIDLTAETQRWVQRTEENHGLLLTIAGSSEAGCVLASSQWDEPSQRPKLVISYGHKAPSEFRSDIKLLLWIGLATGLVAVVLFVVNRRGWRTSGQRWRVRHPGP